MANLTLFERIKKISKQRGMSLQEVAKKAGLGINTIYHWKKQNPSVENLEKVANVLNVAPEILTGSKTDLTIFERIQKIAKKRGMSLRQVNEKAGLGTNAIYRWKKQTPSIDKVEKVAHVLGVTASELTGEKEPPKKSAELTDDDVIFTYEGRQIPPEDLAIIRRLLRGGK